MLKDKRKIKQWLDKYSIENYIINDDFTVDVTGNVHLGGQQLTAIEVQFGEITGSFYCYFNKLRNLKGCPKIVGEDFYCQNNSLNCLEGGPEIVGGVFDCSNNKLTNLIGVPRLVGNFMCSNNNLTSLEGGPETVEGSYYCHENNLTSLKGCPETLKGLFSCGQNPITSIENFKCSFAGSFLHNSKNENERIPLLEHLYHYDTEDDTYSLIINISQLQNALLHHKLHTNISLKDKNLQQKNKL